MGKRDWGERGDFRKVTVTLPPEVYDALVQESARRKSAGDPNHLLSAIAREWFASRQPLLPIERVELSIYRAADFQRPGGTAIIDNIQSFANRVGAANNELLADLLVNLSTSGWLLMEKYSDAAGRHVPFQQWKDIPSFFYQGNAVRIQVTIPGRRRKEALEVKEQQAAAPATAGTE
jgi:hypothetical protein